MRHKTVVQFASGLPRCVVARPTMRFVELKSADQLDLQSLHGVRSRRVNARNTLIKPVAGVPARA